MYLHNVAGTGSYTTSTTDMYHKDRFYVPDKVKHWKKRAFDRIGNVSQTYKKNMKKIARINSTPHVIQACLCTIRSILQVTQRVPPTCTTNMYHQDRFHVPDKSQTLKKSEHLIVLVMSVKHTRKR
jgi:hypothetical protein